MINPYEVCPVYENKKYLLRQTDTSDASDLLCVYSDEKAVPFFNSDNCNGDDFHYTTLERMQHAIEYWQWEYGRKGFVRWSVLAKCSQHAIGTIELFNRQSGDFFNNCGLLRLDLRSDYEREDSIFDILSLIISPAFELFDCRILATKIPSFACERKSAAERLGFTPSENNLIGHNGESYSDYYILKK